MTNLPKYIAILGISFAATMTAPQSIEAQQNNATLGEISTHLKSVGTMSASFTQTDRRGQSLSGTLLLKRPGKIRFEYQKGVPLLIVADGSSLNMIDYEVNQVQRWPIKNSPLSALLDPNQDLSKYGKLQPTSNPNVVSVQVKDPKRPEFGMITMIFLRKAGAPGGLTLDSWVALDSQNNRTTIRLKNVKFNTAISDSSFRWTDPRPKKRR
ncbi:cell envelope biogenesis protein LolA [Sphingorhabdus lutea]|uniref:Cell envelope biogenesis protein LolA n=1 Tax=Sphingorhabdus lutea TaxID=1913578 RepID=A0A1L3JFD9_9SPHN|nr:cell envelope biogenesis protein LolA [Sphingorhabdus lutea]